MQIERDVPLPDDRTPWATPGFHNCPYPAVVHAIGERINPNEIIVGVNLGPVSIQYLTHCEHIEVPEDY